MGGAARGKASRSHAAGGAGAGEDPRTCPRLQQTPPPAAGRTEPSRGGPSCASPASVPGLPRIYLASAFPHQMHENTQEQLAPCPGWALGAHTGLPPAEAFPRRLSPAPLGEVGAAGIRVVSPQQTPDVGSAASRRAGTRPAHGSGRPGPVLGVASAEPISRSGRFFTEFLPLAPCTVIRWRRSNPRAGASHSLPANPSLEKREIRERHFS